MNRYISAIYISILILLLVSCSPTKRLGEGAVLLNNTEVKFEGQKPEKKSNISADLLEIAEPKPNASILGLRLRLGFYNAFANKKKGIGKWIKTKIGEPPVLYDESTIDRSRLIMQKYLIDQGYFQAKVEYDSIMEGKKANIIYEVNSGARYRIRQLDLPPDTSVLAGLVSNNQQKNKIAIGKGYELSSLQEERYRLAQIANDSGFFDVSQDVFYYFLDTAVSRHQVDVFLRIAPPEDATPYRKHYIGKTMVYPQYLLDESLSSPDLDTVRIQEEFRFTGRDTFVRPNIIINSVLQGSGDLYSRKLQSRTVNRLLDLGVFKFVNLKYDLHEHKDSLFLNRLIYLTPGLPQDFTAELEATTESSNFIGTALSATYTHRNIFKGAERLRLNLTTGIETQTGADVTFVNSLDITGRITLDFPRLLMPFKGLLPRNPLQARTSISLANQFQRRTNFFTLNSFQLQSGYNWRPDGKRQHELFPLNISQVQRLNASPEFDELLEENPRLRESFRNYFILGALYRYTLTNQQPNTRKDFFYFQGSLESSGNLAYGLARLGGSSKEEFQLFGLPFAQFIRAEGDFRYHFLDRETGLISRLNIGLAIPYGNSSTVPFIRQFFVGGASSIRAFRIRQLGPGENDSFLDVSNGNNQYTDQTGDIKLEMNLEYRFPMFSYLKGAVFVDAGNVWLYDQSEQIPEPGENPNNQVFKFDRFYREIAVGTGLGLRLDITYFVLRLDLAFPIRKPYLEAGKRWVFDQVDFGSAQWRRNELVLNLALGYPF